MARRKFPVQVAFSALLQNFLPRTELWLTRLFNYGSISSSAQQPRSRNPPETALTRREQREHRHQVRQQGQGSGRALQRIAPARHGLHALQAGADDRGAEAADLLTHGSYFDYLKGRVMKVDLSGDTLETRLYDRDNGEGAAERAIKHITEAQSA